MFDFHLALDLLKSANTLSTFNQWPLSELLLVGDLFISLLRSIWWTTSRDNIQIQLFVWFYINNGLSLLLLRCNYYPVLLLW